MQWLKFIGLVALSAYIGEYGTKIQVVWYIFCCCVFFINRERRYTRELEDSLDQCLDLLKRVDPVAYSQLRVPFQVAYRRWMKQVPAGVLVKQPKSYDAVDPGSGRE